MKNRYLYFGFFLLFWLSAVILYWPAHNSMFVYDFIGWTINYDATGWKGFFNQFGDKGIHPFYHLVFFGLYKCFHLNHLAWFTVFITLHATNALLSFTFFSILFRRYHLHQGDSIAFWGSLFFLLSPYQTEPVIWGATVHYLFTTALILLCLIVCLKYIRNGSIGLLALIHAIYFVALFSLELSFSIPFLLLFLVFAGSKSIFGKIGSFQFVFRVILPQLLWLPAYFLITRIFLGKWIGHYGAAAHLNFSLSLIIGNLNKYLLKLAFFVQFVNYDTRNFIYTWLEKNSISTGFFVFYIIAALWFLVKRNQMANRVRIPFFLFGLFLLGMMTTLNLFFVYITNIEGDRMSYLGSVFLFAMVSAVIHYWFRPVRIFVLGLFLVFSIKFLHYNIDSWRNNQLVIENLENDFRWYDAPKIYLLNLPDNYRGAYMYRCAPTRSLLAMSLKLKTGKDIIEKTENILMYNMVNVSDSVTVEKISDNELKVTFGQWGNWWWLEGRGASELATKDYEVKIDEWNHSYNITFKNKHRGTVYLYQTGTCLRQVEGF
jgi:hypothetical protein